MYGTGNVIFACVFDSCTISVDLTLFMTGSVCDGFSCANDGTCTVTSAGTASCVCAPGVTCTGELMAVVEFHTDVSVP